MPAAGRPVGSASLWRHRDFLLLWSGQTVSEVGSAVTRLALPLLATITLQASTFAVSLLAAASSAAFLLVALQAGALVDRWRKKRILVRADLLRAVVLSTIPIAQAGGVLTIWQLYAVALATSVLSVFFDVAYQSVLPAIVEPDQLLSGNGKLAATDGFAQLAGPSLGGVLVGLVGAADAVVADIVSFCVAGAATQAMADREPAIPPRPKGARLRDEIREGLHFVTSHPILSRIVRATGTANFFSNMAGGLDAVFLVRTLHASPAVIGGVFSLGAVGGLLGAVLASRLARRVGSARIIWLSITLQIPFLFAQPLAFRGLGVLLFAVTIAGTSFGAVVYNTAQVSYRQAVTPASLMGRMNASVRFIVWGVIPLGALAGGGLATVIGVRPTFFVAAAGGCLPAFWVIRSPLFGMRDVPVHPPGEPAHRTP